jgi:hypothetical protein
VSARPARFAPFLSNGGAIVQLDRLARRLLTEIVVTSVTPMTSATPVRSLLRSGSQAAAVEVPSAVRRGLSLPDVMVSVGLAAGLMGMGLLGMERGSQVTLTTARRALVSDLRRARMQATLEGSRVRFEAHGGRYLITQLRDAAGDGTWEVDASRAPKLVELPAGLSVDLASPGSATVAEFDGRGLLVPGGDGSFGSVGITVTDGAGRRELLQIWPSGQVEEAGASSS